MTKLSCRADSGLLSAREREVAALAVQGFTVVNIASRLGVADSTVKTHLRRLYRKLAVSNRTQLAVRLLVAVEAPRGAPPAADASGSAGAGGRRLVAARCCWNCCHYVRPRCRPEHLLEGPPVSVCTVGVPSPARGLVAGLPGSCVEPGGLCEGFEAAPEVARAGQGTG